MNNHQNTTFQQLMYFIKTCRRFFGTGFNKISNSPKFVILPIIHNYIKVSIGFILLTGLSIATANVSEQTVLSSHLSWNASEFSYVDGKPKIVVKKITVSEQKDAKKFHCHLMPLVAYINKGKVELQTRSGDKQTFLAGDSLIEVMNQWHMAHFTKGTEIIAFYLGNDKLPLNVFEGDKQAGLCR